MLYSVLIYGEDGLYDRLSAEQQAAQLDVHVKLQAELKADGSFRNATRLMPPSTAMNVTNNGTQSLVLDGPFAESKEQFLGFYVVDVANMEAALDVAKRLPQGVGPIEVRPIGWSSDQEDDAERAT